MAFCRIKNPKLLFKVDSVILLHQLISLDSSRSTDNSCCHHFQDKDALRLVIRLYVSTIYNPQYFINGDYNAGYLCRSCIVKPCSIASTSLLPTAVNKLIQSLCLSH